MAEISICVVGNAVTAYCDGTQVATGTVGVQFSVTCGTGGGVNITVMSANNGGNVYYSIGNNSSLNTQLTTDSSGICASLATP